MKFLGIFKRGDTIKYSVNFLDDARTPVDPTGGLARWKRPDDVYFNVVLAKIDSKTGWYGASVTTDSTWPLGVYEVRISGTVSGHDWATVLCFQLVNATADDLIEKIIGNSERIIYVDRQLGDDLNDGYSPKTPKRNLAAGILALSSENVIVVAPGNYIENVTLSQSNVHMILRPGVVLNHTTLVPLTVLGTRCRITAWGSKIQAGNTSASCVDLLGSECLLEGMIIEGAHKGLAIGGTRNRVEDCIARGQYPDAAGAAFYLSSSQNVLKRCLSIQTTAGVRGFIIAPGGGPV